jgi:hypothetical protein
VAIVGLHCQEHRVLIRAHTLVSAPLHYITMTRVISKCLNRQNDNRLLFILSARYLRASLTVTNTHVVRQPAEVRGGEGK